MHRFFLGAPSAPQTINVQIGDNFLDGVYRCSHCRENMAQADRFTMEKKAFCTLECMVAAFPLAHSNVEMQAGRRIIPAPPKEVLWKTRRREWLAACRSGLSENDLQRVHEESVVVKVKK